MLNLGYGVLLIYFPFVQHIILLCPKYCPRIVVEVIFTADSFSFGGSTARLGDTPGSRVPLECGPSPVSSFFRL